MPGIEDLKVLLAHMEPDLHPETYVFCHFPQDSYGDRTDLDPVASFLETEGLTLVVPKEKAEIAGLAGDGGDMRMISLRVHSSLSAVGLTAAVAGQLTRHGISANVVAAYYHDHIFVPAERAEDAIQALAVLSADSTSLQS